MNSKIMLSDEKGVEVPFELIATFGMDERDFCALSELDGEDNSIIFFELKETDEGMDFIGVSEDEMSAVIETFEALRDEQADDFN